ncbi:PEP-CTERM sorting domain-containing protein [uncultured Nostoc sp.]|uniref:PEP-CTERM sorting domain-containing protein n=1 Tax=uncultured Nostoc sp. TaxID=340711 RepID=UPI0035CB5408
MRTLSILKTVSAVAAVSAVAITATTGKASAISIDLFSSPTQVASSFTYNNVTPGNNLTATGSVNILGVTQARNVFRSSDGLGVTINNSPLESNKVDGFLLPETLTLAFTQAVNLTSVSFTGVGLLDSFTFLNGGTSVFTQNIPGQLLGNGTYTYNFNFNSPQTGTSFGFRASQLTSAFYVSSVNVAAVPEPITMAGMVLGSGFGVLLRRKYKKAAKFSNKLST